MATDIVSRIRALMPTMSDALAIDASKSLRERDFACVSQDEAFAFCRRFAAAHLFFNLAEFCTEFDEAMGIARVQRRSEVERTAEMLRAERREAAKALRERRQDDQLLRETSWRAVREAARAVLAAEPIELARMYRARGFKRSKPWRGLTATALREQVATVD